MAESLEIKVEGDAKVKVLSSGPGGTEHLLKEAVDDIADRIEADAKAQAPQGETGELKAHPTDRTNTVVGTVEARAPLFGGGFAIQGPLGFVKGRGDVGGRDVVHIVIEVAKEPKHAIWVHEGTGIFGEHHTPIVPRTANFLVFRYHGKKYRRKFVFGQQPQPFLTEAYEYVDRTYVPRRVERLREEIAFLFS